MFCLVVQQMHKICIKSYDLAMSHLIWKICIWRRSDRLNLFNCDLKDTQKNAAVKVMETTLDWKITVNMSL